VTNVHLSEKAWRRIEMRSSPMWVQVYPQSPDCSNPENLRRWDQDLLPQHSGGDKRTLVCSSGFGGSPGEIRTPVGGSLLLSQDPKPAIQGSISCLYGRGTCAVRYTRRSPKSPPPGCDNPGLIKSNLTRRIRIRFA